MVLNIAHRGGAGLWPENTMAAFESALALGCDGIELDVHLSKDGELVVFHDEALKPEIVRDASGRWLETTGPLLKNLTYEALRALDVGRLKPGSRYAARHPDQQAVDGERIPLLRDVIELVRRKSANARLWVELKTALLQPERSASPQQLAHAVLTLLRREDFIERAVVVAFDWNGLIEAKRLEPEIETRFTTLPQSWFRLGAGGRGWIEPPAQDAPPPGTALGFMRQLIAGRSAPWEAGHPSFGRFIGEAVKDGGGNGWFPYHPDLQPDTAGSALKLGLSLAAWTVNEPAEMRRLIGLGCDSLCTDRPDRLKALVETN